VLLYSPGVDPFLEDLATGADRAFYFKEGPRDTPKQTGKTWLKMKDQEDTGGIFVIHFRLNGRSIETLFILTIQ
jgi:hypothetical protein